MHLFFAADAHCQHLDKIEKNRDFISRGFALITADKDKIISSLTEPQRLSEALNTFFLAIDVLILTLKICLYLRP